MHDMIRVISRKYFHATRYALYAPPTRAANCQYENVDRGMQKRETHAERENRNRRVYSEVALHFLTQFAGESDRSFPNRNACKCSNTGRLAD